MGYDNNRVYAECAERNVIAVIPLRRNSGHRESSIPRSADEWKRLYRGRSAVEREFGRLEHHYARWQCSASVGSSVSASMPTSRSSVGSR